MKSAYDLFSTQRSGAPGLFISVRVMEVDAITKKNSLYAFTDDTFVDDDVKGMKEVLHMFTSRRIRIPRVLIRRSKYRAKEYVFTERVNYL